TALRARRAAGRYADRLDGSELGIDALQILAHAAAQAIETLPFRERSSTPTLSLDGGNGVGVEPAAAPAAAPEPPASIQAPEPADHQLEDTQPEPAPVPPAAVPEPSAPEPQAAAWATEEEPAAAP